MHLHEKLLALNILPSEIPPLSKKLKRKLYKKKKEKKKKEKENVAENFLGKTIKN